jgi:hypothetical protein
MKPHRLIPLVLASTRAVFCIAATSLLVGCAVFVNKPDAGQAITALPVAVNLTANATWSNLTVQLTDQANSTTNITPLFTYGPGANEANASLANLANGSYAIKATADVYCWYCGGTSNSTSSTRQFSVNVAAAPPPPPTLTSLTPTSGMVGTSVALVGTGFAAGMSVRFGNATAAAPTVSSATSATAVVPTLPAGAVNVSVKVGTQTSGTRSFAVSATPPPTVEVFRASGTDIQRVSLTPSTNPSVVDTFSAGLSPGGMASTVGCARALPAPGRLLRSTSTNLESCAVNATGAITACTSLGAVLSGTSSDVAISGTLVVRPTQSGIELFRLNANGTLTALGSSNAGTASPTGSSVALPEVATPTIVVRAHANGIDVFDISNPAAPSLAGKVVNAGISTTGVGVKMAGASRAVRAYSSGLDQYDVTNPAAPTRTGAGPLNVGLSTSRASVALFSGNTRAVRSTSSGIEVFDITSNPVRLGLAAGDPSATGTDVVIATTGHAVRTSDEKVEVFDVTTTPNPTLLGTASVTPATTGVCIVNR